jgi:flagellar protein FlaG
MLIQKIQGAVPGAAPAPADRAAPWRPGSELLAVGMRPLVDVQTKALPTDPQLPVDAVKGAVVQANRAMAALSASVTFEVDAKSNTTVVKVIDTFDNSVLRQIPSQEMLDIARALDRLQGMLVHDKA